MIEQEFDRFWDVVPRKVGKGQARRAYTTARKKATPEDLIQSMARYRDDVRRSGTEFVKHPATWLNGECWLDEPEQPRFKLAPMDGGLGPIPLDE